MAPKPKPQKMTLGDFMGDQSLGSWADEMEDSPIPCSHTGYGGGRAVSSAGAFGDRGSYQDRGYAVREELPMPTRPPFTAHLGNLPFDATSGDIEDFFANCQVTNVRIVEDKIERRPKGFGYVEFGSVDGLKAALELNQTQFQGRNIKISIADPPKDRPEMRELNDWSRKGPLPDLPNTRRVSERGPDRGGFRNYDAAAPDMERGGSRRGGPNFEGDGKVRDFSNWERRGPLSPAPAPAPGFRDGGRVRSNDAPREPRESQERKDSPSWGEGRAEPRSQESSRPPRGEFRERERVPTAAELDNTWRARMRPDAPEKSSTPTPDQSAPSSPAQAVAPAMRPKLNLTKRTVSEAEPPSAAASADSKASPFGAARPIDTASRGKEIEDKRQLAIRQKKEADDKARDEKRAKEAAAKAAAAEKAENAETEPTETAAKPNGSETKVTQILSRPADEEGKKEKTAEGARGGGANGEAADHRPAGRGRGAGREPPRGPKQQGPNNWRRKPSGQGGPPAPSSPAAAEASVDEDGWSTVPAKGKGTRGRGGQQSARVAAS